MITSADEMVESIANVEEDLNVTEEGWSDLGDCYKKRREIS